MAQRTRTRAPLNRDKVLRAAMRLADKHGIEALTMRKLARALGVEAMSLYNHVANKSELVEGIVDLALEEIELPENTEAWDAAIRRCATSAHEVLLRHRWACSIVIAPTMVRITPSARLRYMEWLLGRLREAGFSPELAYQAYHALDSHILGFTMWQLGHSGVALDIAAQDVSVFAATITDELRSIGCPYVAEHAEQHFGDSSENVNSEFEFGLDLILDGLRRAVAAARRASRPRR